MKTEYFRIMVCGEGVDMRHHIEDIMKLREILQWSNEQVMRWESLSRLVNK